MADWYSYYENATGKLISTGTVRPGRVRAGITEVFIGSTTTAQERGGVKLPPADWLWNETTHQWENKTTEEEARREAERTEEAALRNLEAQVEAERERIKQVRGG